MIKLKEAKTVGDLIEVLSQYKFSTPINTSCNECRHGWSGGSVIVDDFTKQTYGYIDLRINQSGYKSNLSRSDKEFKCYQMAYFLGETLGSIYKRSDYDLHEIYCDLWRKMYERSTKI
ncbi:Uncharacterized protein BCRIVMBC845_06432 [Bacillus cereus]|nr:Uncharacterized protein BCRIVMBC845_06432 [Bacillus cereus]